MLANISGSELIIVLASLVLSSTLHEAMHAFTAHALGDTTAKDLGRLTINPLKSIDIYTTVLLPMVLIMLGLPPLIIAKPVPFNPDRVRFEEFGAALVGLAGPFTNLFLAGLAALVARAAGVAVGTMTFTVISIFVQINLILFVINMLPIPPLDGSRLLYAVAPEPVRRVMEQIESFGFIAIIVILVGLSPLIGPIITSITQHLYTLLLG